MSSKKAIPTPRPSRPDDTRRPRTAAKLPSAEERATARTVALSEDEAASVVSIMAKLPDPAELPAGALVLVPGEIAGARSLARSVLAVFGRTKTIARALRCSALVARGYVRVGAAADENGDLAWGYAPSA
jgi:hypothetical protein